MAIWTTTPWTLPADDAVILHPEAAYVAVEHDGRAYIFAEALWQKCAEKFGWEDARLRLRHVAEPEEDPARAEATLRAFLEDARVPAEVAVLPVPPDGAAAAIRAASADADLALFGLRPPAEGETDESYGDYLLACRRAADGLPLALYALAAEGIDFRDIFA